MTRFVSAVLAAIVVLFATTAFAMNRVPVAERGIPSDMYFPASIDITPFFTDDGKDMGFDWHFKVSSHLKDTWDKGFVGVKDGLKAYFTVTWNPMKKDSNGKYYANYSEGYMGYFDGSKQGDISAWINVGSPGNPRSWGLVKPWAYMLNGEDNAYRDGINGQTFDYHQNIIPDWRQYMIPGMYIFNLCLEPIDVAHGLGFSEYPQVMPQGQGYSDADKKYGELVDYSATATNGVTVTFDGNTTYHMCHNTKCWDLTVTKVYLTGDNFYYWLRDMSGTFYNATAANDPDAMAIISVMQSKNVTFTWMTSQGGADYIANAFNAGQATQRRYAMYCKSLPMVFDENGNYVTDKNYELAFTDSGIPSSWADPIPGVNQYVTYTYPYKATEPFWYGFEGQSMQLGVNMVKYYNPAQDAHDMYNMQFEPWIENTLTHSKGVDAFYNICKTRTSTTELLPNELIYGYYVPGQTDSTSVYTTDFNCDLSPNVSTRTSGDKATITMNGFNVAPQIFQGTYGIVWEDFTQMAPRDAGANMACMMWDVNQKVYDQYGNWTGTKGPACDDYMRFAEDGYIRPKYMP